MHIPHLPKNWPFWKSVAIGLFAVLLIGAAIVSCIVIRHGKQQQFVRANAGFVPKYTPEQNAAIVKSLTLNISTSSPKANADLVKSLQL